MGKTACKVVSENAVSSPKPVQGAAWSLIINSKMGDAANAHQRNIYNKKIPTLEYVDGQVSMLC